MDSVSINYKKFVDKEYGISISLPDNWSSSWPGASAFAALGMLSFVAPENNGSIRVTISKEPLDVFSNSAYSWRYNERPDMSKPLTLEDIRRNVLKNIASKSPLEEKITIVNGEKVFFIYDITGDPADKRSLVGFILYVLKNKHFYQMSFSMPLEYREKYLGQAIMALKTFEII